MTEIIQVVIFDRNLTEMQYVTFFSWWIYHEYNHDPFMKNYFALCEKERPFYIIYWFFYFAYNHHHTFRKM